MYFVHWSFGEPRHQLRKVAMIWYLRRVLAHKRAILVVITSHCQTGLVQAALKLCDWELLSHPMILDGSKVPSRGKQRCWRVSKSSTTSRRRSDLALVYGSIESQSPQGIELLIENGFISSKDPKGIAAFLFHTDGFNKAMLGEYLGEG
jgi:hypothetical protein